MVYLLRTIVKWMVFWNWLQIDIVANLSKWNETEAAANAVKAMTGKAFTWSVSISKSNLETFISKKLVHFTKQNFYSKTFYQSCYKFHMKLSGLITWDANRLIRQVIGRSWSRSWLQDSPTLTPVNLIVVDLLLPLIYLYLIYFT